MSDRIAVMNNGRIEQLDEPRRLYEVPRTKFVAGFIGKINFLHGRLVESNGQDARVQIELLGEPVPELAIPVRNDKAAKSGDPVTVAIRPEQLRVLPSGSRPDGLISVKGRIGQRTFLGNKVHTEVFVIGGPRLIVEAAPGEGSAGGGDVLVAWPPEKMHLLTE